MSRHLNAGKNHHIKIADTAFETVAEFKHSRMIITHKNYNHK
jgi:hypothetical protein